MSTDHLLLRTINRNQMVFRTIDVERLIEEDHPARLLWEAVGRLDLEPFYKVIGSNTEEGGRPSYPPQLLISVWAYAYSRGIGSAREIDRRCGYEPAFQWLTGMEEIGRASCRERVEIVVDGGRRKKIGACVTADRRDTVRFG